MKVSGALVASMLAAASTVAFTSASSSPGDVALNQGYRSIGESGKPPSEREKFAPKFDGLRFIETLVTAHR